MAAGEEVTLRDGTTLLIRVVTPDDKPHFVAGWQRLSPRSRVQRFHFARGELTAAELAYLTEVDGEDHLAVGALHGDVGVGVARFVRLPAEPDVAELAVTVVDDYQGRGIGRLLLQRLVGHASHRGITHFRAEVLADNGAMLALLRPLLDGAVHRLEGAGVVVIDAPLPRPTSGTKRPMIDRCTCT